MNSTNKLIPQIYIRVEYIAHILYLINNYSFYAQTLRQEFFIYLYLNKINISTYAPPFPLKIVYMRCVGHKEIVYTIHNIILSEHISSKFDVLFKRYVTYSIRCVVYVNKTKPYVQKDLVLFCGLLNTNVLVYIILFAIITRTRAMTLSNIRI